MTHDTFSLPSSASRVVGSGRLLRRLSALIRRTDKFTVHRATTAEREAMERSHTRSRSILRGRGPGRQGDQAHRLALVASDRNDAMVVVE